MSKQYNLYEEEKAVQFIHALDGAARLIHMNNVPSDFTFEMVLKTMKSDYNSDARQIETNESWSFCDSSLPCLKTKIPTQKKAYHKL